MFNFELLFVHGFSSKNREVWHKTALTSQEYEDYFYFFWWGGLRKNGENLFLEKADFAKHPRKAKKWDQSLKNRIMLLFFPSFA